MSAIKSLLSVAAESRSRSKSPGARDRSRSTSNVQEDSWKREIERRKSSKKYSESESGSEDDTRRRYDKRSGKKYYSSDSDNAPRQSRMPRRYDDPDSTKEVYRSSRSKVEDQAPRHRQDTESEDDKYKYSTKRDSRRKSESESDSDSRERRSHKSRPRPNIITASPDDVGPPKVKQAAPAGKSSAHVNAYSYAPPPGHVPQPPGAFPDLPHGALSQTRHTSYTGHDPRYAPPPQSAYPLQPAPDPRARTSSHSGQQYAQVGQFQYAQVDPNVVHKDPHSAVNMYDSRMKPQVVSMDPRRSDSRITDKKYSEDRHKEQRYIEDKYKTHDREADRKERHFGDKLVLDDEKPRTRRPSRLSTGAATLGVGALATHGANGDKPPPSPLLEAYTGTYQTISPMPSALVLAGHKDDSDISDIELGSDDSDVSDNDPHAERQKRIKKLEREQQIILKKREKEEHEHVEYERERPVKMRVETRSPDDDIPSSTVSSRTSRKKVTWYDAESDAKELAVALKGSSSSTKPPNIKPLIAILPHLSIDDLDALKVEYKTHAKIGGQGINMSKHIKARVPGHLGKAAYACSLGQYESDAYWANCFYQSGASRRELLIESLIGRTNQQIREIKNFFKDKKYDDDLEKCLKAELKADKFRSAILLALEERRQAESPVLDRRLVKNDVLDLHDALNSAGGESAMIQIIIVRSDTHLREVLRQYERDYGRNFARDMINKSKNLVGETLAHVLNGALNRSMRDALLLHQAIAETAPGKERAELLISRLVRLHWEPKHLEKVKAQYRQKYGIRLEDEIKRTIQANMKTEEGFAWTNFCIELVRSGEQ